MTPSSWSEARSQMLLDPQVVNLNTGSFGPLPRVVFERVTALRHRLAEEPMDFLLRQAPALLAPARDQLARFLKAEPQRLVFTANATAAINAVAAGLQLSAPGDIVLTDHEYGAMVWCWERAAHRQGLTVRTVPLPRLPRTPEEIVDRVTAAWTPRTRLFFFSHVLSPTGMVLPAQELCTAARQRGIVTVVDGAHAPAMVLLDLEAINADFYAGNCHKWLLAPTGSGFLYLGRESRDRLQPFMVSWGWHYDPRRADQADEWGSTPRLRSFEFEGTRDPSPWLAVPSAIAFQENLGWSAIRERIAELASHVRTRLTGQVGLPPATPSEPSLHGALTAFELPATTDPQALRLYLWQQHRIEVPIIERPDRLLIRISTHWYNTEAEIDYLAHVLPEALRKCQR